MFFNAHAVIADIYFTKLLFGSLIDLANSKGETIADLATLSDDYIEQVCQWLPILYAEGLVDAVDGFCENIAFTAEQIKRVFEIAIISNEYGLYTILFNP